MQDSGFAYVMKMASPVSLYGKEQMRRNTGFKTIDDLNQEFDGVEKVIRVLEEHETLGLKIHNLLDMFPYIYETVQNLIHNIPDIVEFFKLKNFLISNSELLEIKTCFFGGMIYHENEQYDLSDVLKLFGEDLTEIRSFSYADLRDDEYSEILKQKKLCFETSPERSDVIKAEMNREFVLREKLAQDIVPFRDKILQSMDFVGKFDLIVQKAKLAIENNCRRPVVSKDRVMIKAGGNPMVESKLKAKNRMFTKIDMTLELGSTVLTGVNMGGKSVAINTVALNAKLFQYGFFPFAEYAEFPLLSGVIKLTEDYQSLNDGLSAFAGEMKKLNDAIKSVRSGLHLIIYDEPAKGTNPTEGSVIAKAIAKYFSDKKVFLLMSTHFDGVVDDSYGLYETAGLRRNEETVHDLHMLMDYRILPKTGRGAPKDAVRICELIGIDEELLAIIKRQY